MEEWINGMGSLGIWLMYLFFNPFLYIFLIMIYWHYRKIVEVERQLFHIKLHSPGWQTLMSMGYGLLGGLLASLIMLGLGIVLVPADFWILLTVAILLSLFHVKYLCFAYAAGLVSVISLILQQIAQPLWAQSGMIALIWQQLLQLNIPSLLAFVAVLHLIEAVLTRLQGEKSASPLFLQNKRGRIMGAYRIQPFWVVPVMFLVTPNAGAGWVLSQPGWATWWPLFQQPSDLSAGAGFIMLAVPVALGYADMAIAGTPREKVRFSSLLLFIYSGVLLGLAVMAMLLLHPLSMLFAALFAFIGHEWMIWLSHRRDWNQPPLFVQTGEGLRVLGILPGSPAEKMEIEPGDTIVKVNDVTVNRKEELYPAIQRNPAFCKLQVKNMEGHIKLVQRSLYAGEHHQLGVILAPDQDAPFVVEMKKRGLLGMLRFSKEKKRDGEINKTA